ncbi:class I SAM-dependent methyltransferase [Hansschlegelia sp.]|uniref:class I SAM-dependent methyltransferase n=1 Tax=Hansschlegelia sp. TaxID=2041892 RepID=UPI002C4A30DC|nr:methyltransferase domain-containing protein [Hansschlegelia sp.]HVI28890.1 methyltransferase domain-containing protein [Hansschlegelia sp.]
MAAADKAFTGSIAETYEEHLVPLIFQSYAWDMAERLRRIGPTDVLETAAGTGVVTRAIASVDPAPARLVVTDLNQAMLDVARSSLAKNARIEWRQADALALPFRDDSFDAVVCQFGLMFFPDKAQGFREARRVLRQTGKFLFSVWDCLSANEFAAAVTEALAQMFPHDPPRFLPRTPHGYHDVDAIRRETLSAGFSDVEIDIVEGVSRCASSREAAIAYCQGTPLRNEILARDPSGLERATQHAAEALERRFGEGPIEGRIQAIVFAAIH